MATKAKKRREARYASAKDAAKGMQGGFTPTTFTVPDGMELLRFPKEKKTKKYHLDHMPFVVGKGNPADGVEEGDAYWERTFFVHKGFGLPQQFTCNRLTFNKPCAACKKRAKLASSEDADEELLKEMGPKKRMLMLTRCKEMKDKGTMLQEEAYYKSYGEMVKQAIDEADDDGPAARFFHLKGGATAVVKVKQDTYNGREYMKITDVEFEDREKDYKESLLDEMPCLDDLIIPADQDELKEALEGGDEDDDDDDEKPKKKSKKAKTQKKAKDDDEEEEENDDEEDESKDDDSDDDDADEEDEDDEEDEEEDGGDDEESEDEDDDDEEAGLEKGMTVKHKKHGECEVVKVNKDGDVVTLKDEDGDEHRGVKAAECKAVEKEEEDEDEEDEEDEEADIEVGSVVEYVYKKKKRKGEVTKIKKNLVTIEEEGGETRHMKMDELSLAETDDEEEEEDEEEPKKAKKAKKSKKAKDDEDDEDEDDDIPFEEDEDEDDEEEEKPKKKKSKRK